MVQIKVKKVVSEAMAKELKSKLGEEKFAILQRIWDAYNYLVDEGMVADVAIHRDHPDNPHAHVMLTNRPFNPDGTWGLKSKRENILDENGNKTYTGNSRFPRSRKVWLVDWDNQNKKSPNHEVIRTRNMDSPTTVDEEPLKSSLTTTKLNTAYAV